MTELSKVEMIVPEGLPLVRAGEDVAKLAVEGLAARGVAVRNGDVLVFAQKIVSKAEGRMVDLRSISPTRRARRYASLTGKDPRLVELILNQSTKIVAWRRGVMIAEHKLGFIMAQAGVDQSNVAGTNEGEFALLLPENPDASAAAIKVRIKELTAHEVGVVINDSFGRPWRIGTVGVAIGAAGIPSVIDRRGSLDLFGRELTATVIAYADEIAAAASLHMGQADEGRPLVLVRGLHWKSQDSPASALIRPRVEDLFR